MSHAVFQTAQIMLINTQVPTVKLRLPPVVRFGPCQAIAYSLAGKTHRSKVFLVGRAFTTSPSSSSSAVADGDSIALTSAPAGSDPSPASSSSFGPVMKAQYGSFGAVALEKSKLDLSQKQSKSSPKGLVGLGQMVKSLAINARPMTTRFISRALPQGISGAFIGSPVPTSEVPLRGRIYHETYGCQMNINDMEVVLSIMKNAGYTEVVDVPETAEIIFINTCAIRDNAEQKVWQRLNYFWFLKRHWKSNVAIGRSHSRHPPKVVVLGCMAERLKDKILDADKMVDVVCGPDAYRDLPRLLDEVDYGQRGINTLLSLEETYADINPVRISKNSVTAFVSVMRGCNNMCSFCIVPFTRGRERSRPVESIVREVGELCKEGVKEVTLLGQNVNSYNDTTGSEKELEAGTNWKLSDGFSSMSKIKKMGLRFSDLLDRLSIEFPEMRFRYTSPHPKDFPDELLYLMRDRHNICKCIHLPAQSGNSTVLERMRRGYTREAYLDLVHKIRSIIPDVGITSDFISGFCGEMEEEHADTLSLIKEVGYDMAYMFAYSMREKTHAHRNYVDDVPEEVKQRRLTELIEAFRNSTGQFYDSQIGSVQLVLVEGPNKRALDTELIGKSDRGHRVSFINLPVRHRDGDYDGTRKPVVGDFVEVRISKSTRASLFGEALAVTKLSSFYNSIGDESIACGS